jgi:Kef-type K+ transport system membrane component KefB
MPVSRGLLAFVFITMLVYAWTAEVIGQMAPITGAFIAGLLFARSPLRERIEQEISGIAYGIFVPIFFVSVGLEANLRDFTLATFGLFLAMTIGAILGKVIGAGLGAKAAGFTNKESLQLGVGMMSRGEVGLIVANQGINQGIISGGIYTAVVGVILITTLLTPLLLRRVFTEKSDVKTVAQEA